MEKKNGRGKVKWKRYLTWRFNDIILESRDPQVEPDPAAVTAPVPLPVRGGEDPTVRMGWKS